MSQQEILQKVQEFVATVDHRLLAAGAVLLLLLLLFWRVLRRTSRIEREVARLNERLERIREEVRTISRPPLSVAPAKEAPADVAAAPAPSEVPDVSEAPVEEDDVLSRAAASLAEAGAGEESFPGEDETFDAQDEEDSFSFDSSTDAEPNEIAGLDDEAPAEDAEGESFSFGGPLAEEQEPAAEDEAPVAEAGGAAVEEQEPPSGVVRLDSDPARPGVSIVRCLSCNYKLAYPEKLAGKKVRCPSCRTGLDLP